jgi:hypothetical protein
VTRTSDFLFHELRSRSGSSRARVPVTEFRGYFKRVCMVIYVSYELEVSADLLLVERPQRARLELHLKGRSIERELRCIRIAERSMQYAAPRCAVLQQPHSSTEPLVAGSHRPCFSSFSQILEATPHRITAPFSLDRPGTSLGATALPFIRNLRS